MCDICVAINANQKLCKTEAELNLAKGLRNQHRKDFMSARLTVESIKQTAINFPDDNLFIQCDGMDNAKVVLNLGFYQWLDFNIAKHLYY